MCKIRISRNGVLQVGHALHIHLLLLPLILAAYYGGYFSLFVISWMSALLHEAAHLYMAKKCHLAIAGIRLYPFGVCGILKDPMIKSPRVEIIVALAGPIFSFSLSIMCLFLHARYPIGFVSYAITTNTALAVFNLIPCLPLDGGRVLRASLTLGSDAISAWQSTLRLSKILTVFILIGGVYLLLTASFRFSLLLIGVFLLGNLCHEQKSISHQALREILYHKDKLESDTLHRTVSLCAYADLPAAKLLRKLSYHRYYIIRVMDNDEKIIGCVTESQVLHALLNHSIRLTMQEVVALYSAEEPSKNF